MVINIYTDGACSGNQNENNVGGWGTILEAGDNKKSSTAAHPIQQIILWNSRLSLKGLRL